MLTPQEVSERAFQRASFGSGYNMAQVDEFLDVLTQDYSSLYNENAVLKNKMKVLVDKVEEYRSTEDAMRKTLMTAQRMADDIVAEAKTERDKMLREAEAEGATRRDELVKEVQAEEYRLQEAKKATAAFVEQVYALQAEQSKLLAGLRDLCPEGTVPAASQDPVDEAASEIDDNVQRLLAKAMQEASVPGGEQKDPAASLHDTGEYTPRFPNDQENFPGGSRVEPDSPDEPPAKPGRRRPDFGKLQFGRDYEIR